MQACIGGNKHNLKPLSDPYVKYKHITDDPTQSKNYNYNKREELTPGVSYSTLFCPGCGIVIEVISQNSTDKELHNAHKENKEQSEESNGAEAKNSTVIAPIDGAHIA